MKEVDLDAALLHVFESLDRKRVQYITVMDIEPIAASIGMSPSQVNVMFKAADVNQDGKISQEQFCVRVRKCHFFADAQRLFEKLDHDGNGVISREEVISEFNHGSFEGFQSMQAKEFAERIILKGDTNGDKLMDFPEFFYLLTRVNRHVPIFHALANTGGKPKFGLPSLRSYDSISQMAIDVINFTDVAAVSTEFTTSKVVRTLLCGGLSGVIAKSVVAPVMRVKLLFQVTDRKFTINKAVQLTRDMIKNEGVTSLWRGNSAILLRTMPYVSIHYLSHDVAEDYLQDLEGGRNIKLSAGGKFTAGAFAGLVGTVCTYPLDLIRARLAVGEKTTWGALCKQIYRGQGVRGFYRGLVPTLAGTIPYTGTAWLVKGKINDTIEVTQKRKLTTVDRLGSGATAGLIAQAFTYPLEMTRRRMQMPDDPKLGNYSMTQTLQTLVKKEGVKGLFKGFTLNVFKGPIAVGISFTVFDTLKEWFKISKR